MNFKEEFDKNVSIIPNSTGKRFLIEMNLPEVVMECSIVGVIESVNIEIKYVPDKNLLETSSYRRFFKDCNLQTTLEELCSDVYDGLNNLVKPVGLSVRVHRNDGKLLDWGATYSNLKLKDL